MRALLPVLLCALLSAAAHGAALQRSAQTAGGESSSGGGANLLSAVGEAAVSTAAGGAYRLEAGYGHLMAQPGTVTSLVAVAKTTGTLELSWTAPGADGFVGGVAAGFYRIDYSSEPAHVFDPTIFQLELATAAVPGERHSLTLAGLEPNTTYYARVYLADARKSVSETSFPSEESTLAYPPASPALTGVFPSSVTIAWTLPLAGAEGYRLDSSTTSFGTLFPGGVVTTSATANGLTVTLTIGGLTPYTDYFFKVGSLNWQSDVNYSTVLATRTLPGGPIPVLNLALAADALNRTVTLTWTNPVFANPDGVTILVSTNPITSGLVDGTAYPLGTALADGSAVASTRAAVTFLDAGLELDTTRYYSLHSRDIVNQFSVAVSTYIVLDLPPMAPAGLQSAMSVDGTSITLSWAGVTSNLDGSAFRGPTTWELHRFEIHRATGITRAAWTLVASTAASAGSWTGLVPDTLNVYYYRVVSRDAFAGTLFDSAMAADTLGNLYAVAPDQVSRLKIPRDLAATVTPSGNRHGSPLLVRAQERPQDLGGRVVKSVALRPALSPSNLEARLDASDPRLEVVLRYETSGGMITPGGAAALAGGPIPAAQAAERLSAYLAEGEEARKVFGRVDPFDQTVSLQTGLLGNYQIRSVLRGQEFSFDPSGLSNKAITPNGDGLNDTAVFVFENPRDSAVSGRVYDTRGGFVSDMRAGPVAGSSLLWDGKAGGGPVPRGVYIYQIRAEGRTFSGTLVVIR